MECGGRGRSPATPLWFGREHAAAGVGESGVAVPGARRARDSATALHAVKPGNSAAEAGLLCHR